MAAIPRPVAKKSDPPPASEATHSQLRVKTQAPRPVSVKPPIPITTKAAKPVTAPAAPKTPVPPRPAVATKSTPPAPLVGKAQAPRPLAVAPIVAPIAPVAAPTIPTAPVVPVVVVPPPPLPAADPKRASHTDIDLPPYFERQPSLLLDDDESDPDLLRRFETEVVERRKRLTRIAATVMGVAWMLCQIACARGIASSVVDAISSDDDPPPAKAVVMTKDVKKR